MTYNLNPIMDQDAGQRLPLRIRLREVRRRRGQRQADAGEHFGVSQATIQRWENGENRPDLRHIEALAAYLDEPVSAIVDELVGIERRIDDGPSSLATRLAALEARVRALEPSDSARRSDTSSSR